MKKRLIEMFKFELMQRKWGRKLIGGTFYYVFPYGLPIAPHWTDFNQGYSQEITLLAETY